MDPSGDVPSSSGDVASTSGDVSSASTPGALAEMPMRQHHSYARRTNLDIPLAPTSLEARLT